MTEIFSWFGCGLLSLIIYFIICVFANKEITRKDALMSIFIFLAGPTFLVAAVCGIVVFGIAALLITTQQKLFEKFNIHMPKIDLDKTVWKRK